MFKPIAPVPATHPLLTPTPGLSPLAAQHEHRIIEAIKTRIKTITNKSQAVRATRHPTIEETRKELNRERTKWLRYMENHRKHGGDRYPLSNLPKLKNLDNEVKEVNTIVLWREFREWEERIGDNKVENLIADAVFTLLVEMYGEEEKERETTQQRVTLELNHFDVKSYWDANTRATYEHIKVKPSKFFREYYHRENRLISGIYGGSIGARAIGSWNIPFKPYSQQVTEFNYFQAMEWLEWKNSKGE